MPRISLNVQWLIFGFNKYSNSLQFNRFYITNQHQKKYLILKILATASHHSTIQVKRLCAPWLVCFWYLDQFIILWWIYFSQFHQHDLFLFHLHDLSLFHSNQEDSKSTCTKIAAEMTHLHSCFQHMEILNLSILYCSYLEYHEAH